MQTIELTYLLTNRKSNAMTHPKISPARGTGTQTVDRTFDLLKAIAAHNAHGVSLHQLTDTTRLHRTTAHRLLRCLVRQGAARQDEVLRRYFLGPLAIELSLALRPQLDLTSTLSSSVSRIAGKTGDTSFLILRTGNDGVCIDRKLGSFPTKTVVVDVGTRRPLGIGAGSLAILSQLPDQEMERVVLENSRNLLPFDKTPDFLLKSARAAKRLGYVTGPVFGVDNASSLGVAIRAPSGEVIAAFSVAAISTRMTRSRQLELVRILQEESRTATERLKNTNVIDSA